MKKYDQPLCDSNSILNKLFLKARRQVFQLRNPAYPVYSPMQLRAQVPLANAKHRGQKKTETNSQDKDFQKWLSLLDNHQLHNNTHQSIPVIKKPTTNRKPRASIDLSDKLIDVKSPEPSTEQPTKEPQKQTKKTTSKKEQDEEESQPSEASARRGNKVSVDTNISESVEPKEIKIKIKSTATVGASCTTPKTNSQCFISYWRYSQSKYCFQWYDNTCQSTQMESIKRWTVYR